MDLKLPDDVRLLSLTPHTDSRRSLTEVFRAGSDFPAIRQCNFVRSEAHILRGVHVHPQHANYLAVLEGTQILGLRDMRPPASTFGQSMLLALQQWIRSA